MVHPYVHTISLEELGIENIKGLALHRHWMAQAVLQEPKYWDIITTKRLRENKLEASGVFKSNNSQNQTNEKTIFAAQAASWNVQHFHIDNRENIHKW